MHVRYKLVIIALFLVVLAQAFLLWSQNNELKRNEWSTKVDPKVHVPLDNPAGAYQKTMTILSESGVEKARDFIQPIFDESGDPLCFFALAWIDYKAGDYQKSMKRVDYLIASEKQNSKVKAFALHLKGYLFYAEGEVGSALSYFFQAEELNTNESRPKEVFRNRMGLVRCYAYLGEFSSAKNILIKAFDSTLREDIPNVAYFYSLQSFVEFNLGNVDQAITFETECGSALVRAGDHVSFSFSLLRLSFFKLVQGDLDSAIRINEKARERLADLGLNMPLEYKVNRYLISKCDSSEESPNIESLVEEIESKGTFHHRQLYKEIARWECPSNSQTRAKP